MVVVIGGVATTMTDNGHNLIGKGCPIGPLTSSPDPPCGIRTALRAAEAFGYSTSVGIFDSGP